MHSYRLAAFSPIAVVVLAAAMLSGCSHSRAELLREHSALVERKLEAERDRVLSDRGAGNTESCISHLQTLRMGLSMVNVSIVTVPLVLNTEEQRAIGYSVLDEALGTIDWNIPIYRSTAATPEHAYPTLFSPQSGLDFNAIRQGNGVPGIAR